MSNRKTSPSLTIFMSVIVLAVLGFLFLVSTKIRTPERNQEQTDSLQADRRIMDSIRSKYSVIEDSLTMMKLENDKMKSSLIKDTVYLHTDSTNFKKHGVGYF